MNVCSSSEQDKIQITIVFLTYTFLLLHLSYISFSISVVTSSQPISQPRDKKLMIGIILKIKGCHPIKMFLALREHHMRKCNLHSMPTV